MSRPDPVVVTPAVLRDWPLPAPGDSKQSRGQVLVAGGSAATPGAVLLAGTAALRAGAGKLVLATVADTCPALGVAVPEAAVRALPQTGAGEIAVSGAESLGEWAQAADALLLGSGCGDPDLATELIEALVPDLDLPVTIDALGSAYLTHHPEGLHRLEGRVVATLNPTEMAHVAGCEVDEVEEDPWAAATAVARRSRVVVLFGGERKHVVAPDGRAWLIEGGGPGLGVSGSGDVQAGIVTGLLARGADPAQAAVWGAYLHARTGERLAATVGQVGYLAGELLGEVPRVLSELG
ncbi:NAD(P)H-hydrate dehydratase [Nocardioides houyundeii]|uniref:NAD(P)H-hydrate dehydratase n=1 Tax=Nocardioides houyundeii TaxID=2045452 RepID=UPI000C758069|nr:NAD(P)H-hydrate dehydratase [Nocardioides houyundeii]